LAERNSDSAAAVSAHAPAHGVSFVSFMPMVRTMRQPPVIVPSAMARWQTSTIQKGNPTVPCSKEACWDFQIVA